MASASPYEDTERGTGDEEEWDSPMDRLAELKHEFGEHGGVNMSIERSSTFTVLTAQKMPEIFQGLKDGGRRIGMIERG